MRYIVFLIMALIIGSVIYDSSTQKPEPISGFIVAKEFTPQHMDDKTPKKLQEATFIPVVVPHKHTPVLVKSTFMVYLANRWGVNEVSVDSLKFTKLKVGQRWATLIY